MSTSAVRGGLGSYRTVLSDRAALGFTTAGFVARLPISMVVIVAFADAAGIRSFTGFIVMAWAAGSLFSAMVTGAIAWRVSPRPTVSGRGGARVSRHHGDRGC